jgi:hypothetical protein
MMDNLARLAVRFCVVVVLLLVSVYLYLNCSLTSKPEFLIPESESRDASIRRVTFKVIWQHRKRLWRIGWSAVDGTVDGRSWSRRLLPGKRPRQHPKPVLKANSQLGIAPPAIEESMPGRG